MELKGKKIAILVEDMYNEFEFWYPFYRLKEAGAEVTVIGSGRATTFNSKSGLPVNVNAGIDNVSASAFDGLIIPGGFAPDMMRRVPAMVKFVKDIFGQGKPVAAICHAGWMLASAEVVKGKKITSFFSIKDDMVHAGGNWVDEEVVVDGNLITSRTPDDLPAFMKAYIGAFKN